MNRDEYDAALRRGIRLGLNAAMASLLKRPNGYKEAGALLVLNPEAVLDQLTSEAQADNMRYDND